MFGKTARTLSNCDIFSAKQLEGEKDFSNWYANSMSRIEYLNNLITNDDTVSFCIHLNSAEYKCNLC